MPDLAESLQGRDLGHLRIIAELWGLELLEQDPHAVLMGLVSWLTDPNRVSKMVGSLSPDVREALTDLVLHAGRLPWAQFTRSYGELREMGVARRDREQPHKQPISAVEMLWYRGFVASAFFDNPTGPQEFAYIPDDLLRCIPVPGEAVKPPMGRQASTTEYARVTPVNDRILDHACTLLAALRLGTELVSPFSTPPSEELTPPILASMLSTCGLLDKAGMPLPEPVRIFLESPRADALAELARSWQHNPRFNELHLLPNLSIEGNWQNDPLRARQAISDYMLTLPAGTWWSLDSFIAAIKQHNPDFQRPAGDYDSWFIRDCNTGQYMRGFEHWDDVDGRLIRYLLTGPLHWIGVLDLACSEASEEVTAFRLSGWSHQLLLGEPPKRMSVEDEPLIARSDARVSARRLVPRRVRYQLARFCEWGKETPEEYQYQISPASLTRAHQQGLSVNQLITLLNRYSKAVPPSLLKALERWEKIGSEARLEKLLILRVTSVEVLQALRKSRASRFLGEPIGPTTISIKPGAAQKVLSALAELGYLGEIRGDVD
jgi:hypothetical protein